MFLKSFKQYLIENDDWKEISPGYFWDGSSDAIGLSKKTQEWLKAHAGLHVTDKLQGKIYMNKQKYGTESGKDPETYSPYNPHKDYFLIKIYNFKSHFEEQTTFHIDNVKSEKIPKYFFMFPENRKKIQDVLLKLGVKTNWEFDDTVIKKRLKIEDPKELYIWESDFNRSHDGIGAMSVGHN